MIPPLLTVAALFPSGPPIAEETEYVLQVEERGHISRTAVERTPKVESLIDGKTPDGKPRGNVLHSIEMNITRGQPFRLKVIHGKETRELSGVLKMAADGTHALDISYASMKDVGVTIPKADGTSEPALDKTGVKAGATLSLDTPHNLGGMVTRSETTTPKGTTRTESSAVFWVTLRKKPQ